MKNPKIPAIHFNTRFIVTSKEWFGGGIDVTPCFEDNSEKLFFHKKLKEICSNNNKNYIKYKKLCDRYFYLPHRKEPRGIGGIFFDVEIFSVKSSINPNELLMNANDAGLKLFKKLLKNFDKKNYLKINNKYKWSNKKYTRKDFEKLCNLSDDIEKNEFIKRLNACSFPGYNNLFLNIDGKKFQIITNE